MRSLSPLLALAALVVGSLACAGASTEQDLVPAGGHVDPASVGVDPFAGRWRPVQRVEASDGEEPAGFGLAEACGDRRFVEIRSDGIGGWELVAGGEGSLRVIELRSAEATAEGARLQIREPTLDEGEGAGESVATFVWVEPGRIGTFSVHPDALFASPAAAATLSDAPCGGPPTEE